ncbi:hypothetical protein C8046_01730 [Serinibacter arcticus]|uniref:N-acetyltransferase domain-containing protein n=1 Tax=Serinibacter arcticus TaxID=1655435 RepID=A0A2U1ZRK2_9MICO|nr:hypothetical protein C8046_01730 [Serinibacter arcticus]
MLAVILEEAGAEHPLGAPLGVPAPGILLRRLRAFVDNHPGRISVAEVGTSQVGAAISQVYEPGLFSETPWLQVEILYVRPEWRRRGVGRALMADQAVFAASAGTDTIVTLPVSGARSEQRFLSRLGFSAVGSRRTCEVATLHRRLGQDTPRGGLEAIIARRRAMNERVNTPPRGIELPPPEDQDGVAPALFPAAPAVVEPLAPSSRRQVRRAELMRRSASSVTSTR